ncbi:MAG TPA: L-seryl-tRNA(Sec) selenium transferase [Candidatus Sulfotelmatobacter sp.]|nr:L-seryl-tRNA(Sec) selenium transferase [Candidatus Sulfotelmatobacter sp.]
MSRAPDPRRRLPAIESLLHEPALAEALRELPRALVVEAVRAEVASARRGLRARQAAAPSPAALAGLAAERARREGRPPLRRVLNATGIVLHTNLGRAPLAAPASRAIHEVASGYCNLEYDLVTGRRGQRGIAVQEWIGRLTGAEAAVVVNNGAAAILLALSALARGRGVIVSRGELVEIGGSFRVPEIMEQSGARLIEVGTTNRTHLRDYQRALERHDDVAAVLRVHPSNFRVRGFTARPELPELAALAHRRRLPLIEDLGSGALLDLATVGLEHEPTAAESLAAGADVVTFSGDKLLGGAQAGLLIGRRRYVERAAAAPLARALRPDKLALAALAATLPLYADPERAVREIPALAMLRAGEPELRARAERLAALLKAALPAAELKLARGEGEVGGGSLPGARLTDWLVEVALPGMSARELEGRVRAGEPPLLGTIRAGRFRLDVRTLFDADLEVVAGAVARAVR